jgi:hypothetical protein
MVTATLAPHRSKAHPVESVPLVQYASGELMAMSLTTPGQVYTITLTPRPSCTCKGWQYRGQCCHVATAQEKVCYWCDRMDPSVQVYRNGFDGGAPLALCSECLNGR